MFLWTYIADPQGYDSRLSEEPRKTCIFLPQAFCHTQYSDIIHYTVTFLLILEQYGFSEVISETLCDH